MYPVQLSLESENKCLLLEDVQRLLKEETMNNSFITKKLYGKQLYPLQQITKEIL